jgi:flagellar M-ring protein FliF
MRERIESYLRGLSNKWKSLEKGAKIRLVSVAAVLTATLAMTVFILARPRMAVLRKGLDAVAVSQITAALDDEGIKSNVTGNSTTVEVAQKDLTDAQIALAVANAPSHSGSFTYEDALNYSGMGATETVKLQNFKRVKENDLAESLTRVDGVRQASVQLVIPEPDNYFIKNSQKSSAGVVLMLDRPMDKNRAAGIARYIARSVEGLDIENVEIIDQDGQTLYSGTSADSGVVGSEYDVELVRKNEIEAKIRATLAPLYDEVHPTINLVLNWDRRQEKGRTFTSPVEDSSTGLVTAEKTENRTVTGGETQGEPGVAANDAVAPTYEFEGATALNETDKNRTAEYLYNETESIANLGFGEIKLDESSGSVIAYKYKKYDEEYLTDNNLLEGMTWQQFRESKTYELVDVESDIVEALRAGTGIRGLTLIGFDIPVFYDRQTVPVNWRAIVMLGVLAFLLLLLALELFRNARSAAEEDIEPELSVEDLLISTRMEEQREAEIETEIEAMKRREIHFGKESEAKRAIDKFVDEEPEAVALLLRNWLNKEWE